MEGNGMKVERHLAVGFGQSWVLMNIANPKKEKIVSIFRRNWPSLLLFAMSPPSRRQKQLGCDRHPNCAVAYLERYRQAFCTIPLSLPFSLSYMYPASTFESWTFGCHFATLLLLVTSRGSAPAPRGSLSISQYLDPAWLLYELKREKAKATDIARCAPHHFTLEEARESEV
jgi:hypothetical protein